MAGFDAFLEITGIKGETEDKQLKDHIELMSYSFGASQAGRRRAGGRSCRQPIEWTDRCQPTHESR